MSLPLFILLIYLPFNTYFSNVHEFNFSYLCLLKALLPAFCILLVLFVMVIIALPLKIYGYITDLWFALCMYKVNNSHLPKNIAT